MSAADVSAICVLYACTRFRDPELGIDPDLLGTFEDALRRCERAYSESLSLADLFELFSELLDLSATDSLFTPQREVFKVALMQRVRGDDLLPHSFPIAAFLDACREDLDQATLASISAAALHRVRASRYSIADSDHIRELLLIEQAYADLNLKPSSEYVEAIKRFISYLRMSKTESVKVVVRCRPLSLQEAGDDQIVSVDELASTVEICKPLDNDSAKVFTFDAAFGSSSSQAVVYSTAAQEIVNAVLDGYNGTIFAYGQTGAGKTHTMTGTDADPGIIPRVFSDIFNSDSQDRVAVRVSFLEIYNEEIRDLLVKPAVKLDLHDRPDGSVGVKGLSQISIPSLADMRSVLQVGLKSRATGSTLMNAESSRSHSIFTISVESMDANQCVRTGKLNLVDLAGSERQSKTGATGETLKEAAKINLSLSALGNVISALATGGFVPYRDSKLTRLLQDSLGGNTKTVMISNVSPSERNVDESLSTLRYAARAKHVKNKPRVNEDPKDTVIKSLKAEIAILTSQLERQGPAIVTDTYATEESLLGQIDQVEELARKLEKLAAKYKRVKQDLKEAEQDFDYERDSLLVTIRDLQKVNKLNDLIIDWFIPETDLLRFEDFCMYDDQVGEWSLDAKYCQETGMREAPKFELARAAMSKDERTRIINESVYYCLSTDGELVRESRGERIPLPVAAGVQRRPQTADRHGRRPPFSEDLIPRAKGLVKPNYN